MKWASSLVAGQSLEKSVAEAAGVIGSQLGSDRADVLFVFVSDHYRSAYEYVPKLIGEHLDANLLIGCSAGGVIGDGHEAERSPALSVTAASLPDVDVTPLLLDSRMLPDAQASPAAWEEVLHVPASRAPSFVLLPDPFTLDTERLLGGLDRTFPNGTKVGGLVSGGARAEECALFLGQKVHRSGLVGVALSGNVRLDSIVAQGCRPIGEPMFVTGCEGGVLHSLDGRSPIELIRNLYQESNERDRQLFQNSLFVGIVMDDRQEEYGRGDFLIRNIVGVEEKTGRLGVGAALREGMVVQFHLRDASTSAEDLRELLSRYAGEVGSARPAGSLLFSCLGRGVGLYGEADHDSSEFRRHLGDVPLGGFFCNGEIGPVHGTTFLHGYTSSFGLFRDRR